MRGLSELVTKKINKNGCPKVLLYSSSYGCNSISYPKDNKKVQRPCMSSEYEKVSGLCQTVAIYSYIEKFPVHFSLIT